MLLSSKYYNEYYTLDILYVLRYYARSVHFCNFKRFVHV